MLCGNTWNNIAAYTAVNLMVCGNTWNNTAAYLANNIMVCENTWNNTADDTGTRGITQHYKRQFRPLRLCGDTWKNVTFPAVAYLINVGTSAIRQLCRQTAPSLEIMRKHVEYHRNIGSHSISWEDIGTRGITQQHKHKPISCSDVGIRWAIPNMGRFTVSWDQRSTIRSMFLCSGVWKKYYHITLLCGNRKAIAQFNPVRKMSHYVTPWMWKGRWWGLKTIFCVLNWKWPLTIVTGLSANVASSSNKRTNLSPRLSACTVCGEKINGL
jgi:hypothetical protein